MGSFHPWYGSACLVAIYFIPLKYLKELPGLQSRRSVVIGEKLTKFRSVEFNFSKEHQTRNSSDH